MVGFLGDLKTPNFHSEINWPLVNIQNTDLFLAEVAIIIYIPQIMRTLFNMARWNSVRLKYFIQLLSETTRLEPLLIQGISWQNVVFNLAVNSDFNFWWFSGFYAFQRQAQKEFKYSEDQINQQNSKNINSPESI